MCTHGGDGRCSCEAHLLDGLLFEVLEEGALSRLEEHLRDAELEVCGLELRNLGEDLAELRR